VLVSAVYSYYVKDLLSLQLTLKILFADQSPYCQKLPEMMVKLEYFTICATHLTAVLVLAIC